MQTTQNYPSAGQIIPFPRNAAFEPVVELINDKPMTTSLQVAAFFGKEHKNVLQDIRNILAAVGDSTGLNFQLSEYKDSTGRSLPMYLMDKDAFTLLVMGYTGEDAMRFKLAYIRRFNEMERHLRDALPNFNDPIEAAEAFIAAEKARRAAEQIACDAIRTKAEIGTRREATSMATASAAVRKNHALEDVLGIGRKYRQVKAISWLLDEFVPGPAMYSQVGKKLSEISSRMGYPTRLVPDEKYPGGVKSYHIDVIDAFRGMLRTDLNMLAKFRRR